jgi:hypothetical protein
LLQTHPAGHAAADFILGHESQSGPLVALNSLSGWQKSSVKRAGGAGGHW